MGRQSAKHTPRVDDQMKHEQHSMLHGSGDDSHAREDLAAEAPTEGEPTVDLTDRPDIAMPGGPTTIDPAEARERAELARHLAGVAWPARPPQIAAAAAQDYAPDHLVEAIVGLPPDVSYPNVGSLWQALGGTLEMRDRDPAEPA